MNKQYFSEKGEFGLTSTQANHYANLAKEMQEANVNKLKNIKFFHTYISVVGQDGQQLMSKGINDISFIEETLTENAKLNSFCAWVREAIKHKEELDYAIRSTRIDDWYTLKGIEVPKGPEHVYEADPVSELEVMNTWSTEKRMKYLDLEAKASTFGKYIHPNGPYSDARKLAHEVYNIPINTNGNGRDTMIYTRELTVPIEEIDSLFLQLQSTHRRYEKELNYMKAELKNEVQAINHQNTLKYQQEYADYEIASTEYRNAIKAFNVQFKDWMLNELANLANLKIRVPEHLMETYEYIKRVDSSK